MRLVKVAELKAGMVLGEDIYTLTGTLLVSDGTALNDGLIKTIERMGTEAVKIRTDADIGQVEESFDELMSLDDFEDSLDRVYQQSYEAIDDLFNKFKLGTKIVSEELDHAIAPILNEVNSNNNIAKKLWQLESFDNYTYDHSIRVSLISALLSKWLGIKGERLKDIAIGGLLHDIGKIKIPDEILNKPGKLTDTEFQTMKKHTLFGLEILKDMQLTNRTILNSVLDHHERINGTGYPRKLVGSKISIEGRIVAIADTYAAMTTDRIYQDKKTPFEVAKHILQASFNDLDPYFINIFLNNLNAFYIGNIVKLSNGEMGTVIMIRKDLPERPLVRVGEKFVDLSMDYSIKITEVID